MDLVLLDNPSAIPTHVVWKSIETTTSQCSGKFLLRVINELLLFSSLVDFSSWSYWRTNYV